MKELSEINGNTCPQFGHSDALTEFERDHVLADHINDLVEAVEDLQGEIKALDRRLERHVDIFHPLLFCNHTWKDEKCIYCGTWYADRKVGEEPCWTITELREKEAEWLEVGLGSYDDEFFDWLEEQGNNSNH
jgi:hypothetical protein